MAQNPRNAIIHLGHHNGEGGGGAREDSDISALFAGIFGTAAECIPSSECITTTQSCIIILFSNNITVHTNKDQLLENLNTLVTIITHIHYSTAIHC